MNNSFKRNDILSKIEIVWDGLRMGGSGRRKTKWLASWNRREEKQRKTLTDLGKKGYRKTNYNNNNNNNNIYLTAIGFSPGGSRF